MRIIEYEYEDVIEPGWKFQKMILGNVNLIVGQSAVGKSKFLNTVTNLCKYIIEEPKRDPQEIRQISSGKWIIKFSNDNNLYKWKIEAKERTIRKEELSIIKDNVEKKLIIRNQKSFKYKKKQLPKLDLTKLSVSLLKNEDEINTIYNAFSKIYRRNFFRGDLEEQSNVTNYNTEIENKLKKDPNAIKKFPVSTRLLFLKNHKESSYKFIVDYYKEIFPFIKKIEFIDIRKLAQDIHAKDFIPTIAFSEKHSKKPTPFFELSSGMQKVLLILTDVFTMPKNSIYIIDEYENSLGVNAIDFFPDFLVELPSEHQFLITSHHPYLINTIPVEQWQVFQRKGQIVKIVNGSNLKKRYGKSKQKTFTQLINDELYVEGVE